MKKIVPSILCSHGIISLGIGFAAFYWVPDMRSLTSIICWAGGGLSLMWALLGILGKPQRGWAMLTLSATAFTLISQAVMNWLPQGQAFEGTRTLAILATVGVAVTVGALIAVAHIGVTLMIDSPAPSQDSSVRRDAAAVNADSERWRSERRPSGRQEPGGTRNA